MAIFLLKKEFLKFHEKFRKIPKRFLIIKLLRLLAILEAGIMKPGLQLIFQ